MDLKRKIQDLIRWRMGKIVWVKVPCFVVQRWKEGEADLSEEETSSELFYSSHSEKKKEKEREKRKWEDFELIARETRVRNGRFISQHYRRRERIFSVAYTPIFNNFLYLFIYLFLLLLLMSLDYNVPGKWNLLEKRNWIDWQKKNWSFTKRKQTK